VAQPLVYPQQAFAEPARRPSMEPAFTEQFDLPGPPAWEPDRRRRPHLLSGLLGGLPADVLIGLPLSAVGLVAGRIDRLRQWASYD
jgi:hypothetical protein